jgi:putative transposase
MRMQKRCERCGKPMQRWGKTHKGTARFFCPVCKKTSVRKRKDNKTRHILYELDGWLDGKESLSEIGSRVHRSRQALWKDFHPFFEFAPEQVPQPGANMRVLILDGTYVHGHALCVLIAIDEHDNLFWKFAPYESYASWHAFLVAFPQPEIVVMDGQKGLFSVVRMIWPSTKIQRCQFHVVSFAIQYLGRFPKDEAGKAILDLLYRLKYAKTFEKRDQWILLFKIWEKQYEKALTQKNEFGRFQYPRLRSTRLIIRRALPNLFTFLDYPGTPNTTNLVEGWTNGAIAEALRLHRGLRIHEKKALVAIVLSHLSRGGRIEKLNIPRAWLERKAAREFPTEAVGVQLPFDLNEEGKDSPKKEPLS